MSESNAETSEDQLEVSFVMPCLDEAETLEGCIENAKRCISEHGLRNSLLIAIAPTATIASIAGCCECI